MGMVRDGEHYAAWDCKANPETMRHARYALYSAKHPYPEFKNFTADVDVYREVVNEWCDGRDRYLAGTLRD